MPLTDRPMYFYLDRPVQELTTVNDLPNQFALTRLGKKVMWGGSHKVSSYQTLVRRHRFNMVKVAGVIFEPHPPNPQNLYNF